MNVRSAAVTGATVLTLTVGGLQTFAPPSSPNQRDQRTTQQQVDQGSDAQEHVNTQLRRDGAALQDADNAERLRPGEYRPLRPEPPRLRLPVRLP